MRIKLVLAKVKLREVKVDVPDDISRKKLLKFAAETFPGYELVDIITPDEEDYDLPLTIE